MERTLILLKPDCVQRRLGRPGYRPLGRKRAEHHRHENDARDARTGQTPLCRTRRQGLVSQPGSLHHFGSHRGPDRRRPGGDPRRSRDGRRHQRPQRRSRHDPRRSRHEPADESRPRLRRPRGRPARNADLLPPGRTLRIHARPFSPGCWPKTKDRDSAQFSRRRFRPELGNHVVGGRFHGLLPSCRCEAVFVRFERVGEDDPAGIIDDRPPALRIEGRRHVGRRSRLGCRSPARGTTYAA